jgi:uncharacterized protein (DUF58 family)
LGIVIFLVCGVLCAIVAAHKGRNAVGWFFIGFLFNLLALIMVCVVSNLKEQRARFERANQDRRRLREELRMERMQRTQAMGQVHQRIDIHDRAIGISTAKAGTPPALPASAPPQVIPPRPETQKPRWFYAPPGGEKVGPVHFTKLANEFRMGRLHEDTLIWKQGWEDWRPASEVPEITEAMEG